MMGEWSEKIMQAIRQRIAVKAEEIGREMVSDIQKAISTPVVRSPSGFFVIQRSPSFEDPWLETGNLWREQYYEVYPRAPIIELNVFNTAIYARRLNDGHDNVAPRPFYDFARERWTPLIPDLMGEAISAGNLVFA